MRTVCWRKLVIAGILSVAILVLAAEGWSGDASRATSLWSLQPVRQPVPPAASARAAIYSPVDAFVASRWAGAAVRPLPEADRASLLRRACFDLLGLPPEPEQVTAFVADERPDAYERLVDRLLASPRFGERFARHWLDTVRYADSDGFKTDALRPLAHRYRDWVIRAFNENMPYDDFVRLQIAGDELDPFDPGAVAATTYLRLWPFEDNQRDLVRRRQDILNDITDTTAIVFLGLTLKCARCHDHKFDPLNQEDYYSFQSFFAGVRPEDRRVGTLAEVTRYEEAMRRWEQATAAIRAEMKEIEQPYREAHFRDARSKFPPDVQEAIDTPSEQRTPVQRQLYALARNQLEPTTEQVLSRMKKEDRSRWEELNEQLKKFETLLPPDLPTIMTVAEVTPEPPPTYVLARGVARAPLHEVEPAFPACLGGGVPRIKPVRHQHYQSSGRRLALANWLTDPANPLTPRVFVNRIWLHLLGEGIVATPGDFGSRGARPTHPELLDWLAAHLVGHDWNVKRLVREIAVSATYRRSSRPGENTSLYAANETVDPQNRLYWRANRKRLEGEVLRDAMLAVAGELNFEMYGPAVRPALPTELGSKYAWKPDSEEQQRRRSVYLLVRRNLRYPLFEAFDFPDANEPCTRRNVTVTAPQAHYLLNSELTRSVAAKFAERLLRECGADELKCVERGFWLAFGRAPTEEERYIATRFLSDQKTLLRAEMKQGITVKVFGGEDRAEEDVVLRGALEDFCLALLNANEFIFVD